MGSSAADNKDIVRRVEEAWGRNDTATLDQYFAPDFDNAQSGAPGLPVGLAGAKMAHGGAMTSFPDRRVRILDLIAEDDRVFVRAQVTGTNTGGAAFLGAPEANGARIDFEMWGVYQLRDGKVVAHWGLNDGVLAMMQVGALKPPM